MVDEALITHEVQRKLDRLRQAIRAHLLGEGLAWTVMALAVLVAVTFAIDWGLHRLTHQPVPRALRALLLGICVAGVAYVVWRRLLRPVLAPLHADDLALVVEKRYGGLGDRLISAVQFARRDWQSDANNSPALVRRMADQANALAGELNFLSPLNRRRLWKRAAAAGGTVVVLAFLAAASQQTMLRLFQRNILLQNVDLPQQTYLDVEGGPEFRVVRGDDLSVTVRVRDGSSVTPRRVRFHMQYGSVGKVEETVQAATDGVFVKVFPAVTEPLEFYVTGNDDRTKTCTVRIIEPPEVRRIDLVIQYPEYTKAGQREVQASRGAVEAPLGGFVTVTAAVTKPIRHARMLLDADTVAQDVKPVTLTMPGDPEPTSAVVATFQLLPAQLDARRAVLRFELTDPDGRVHAGNSRCVVNILHDEKPKIDVAWPALGKKITAYAMIPVEIEASDTYGLTAIAPRMTIKGLSREPYDMPAVKVDPGAKRVTASHKIDLLPLGLTADDESTKNLQVWLEAGDTLPPPEGPNVSQTAIREFEIVAEQELLADLLAQQKEMRLRMDLALAAQAAARDAMLSARDMAAAGGSLTEPNRLAGDSGRQQQSVDSLLGSIADVYREILQVLINNRVGEAIDQEAEISAGRQGAEADRNRLQLKIIDPLTRMIGEPMGKTQAAIRLCEQQGNAAALADDAARIAAAQQAFYDEMVAIRDEMGQLETIHEFVRSLNLIIQESIKVERLLNQRAREATGNIFDTPSTAPATGAQP